MKIHGLIVCSFCFFCAFALGCSQENKISYKIIENSQKDSANFVQIERIILEATAQKDGENLSLFLLDYIQKYPKDNYNAYYFYVVSSYYKSMGTTPLALYYLRQAESTFPDVFVKEKSIHLDALQDIVSLSSDPMEKFNSYKKMLNRFSGSIDKGKCYYYMAKSADELAMWDESLQAYKDFLKAPKTDIPQDPNVYRNIHHRITFASKKNPWVYDNLDDLLNLIKRTINQKRINLLSRYHSNDFFSMTWDQEEGAPYTRVNFSFNSFNSNVHYSQELDSLSNDKEAFLRTWGWTYRMPVWYLYFRRIDYPVDPELNNKWEWAGIYFGEKI